jgi:hypothetical protein
MIFFSTSVRSCRIATASLALAACALAPGCLTCAMWDRLDHTPGEKTAAVVLTPVTFAVDAALFAGYVYVEAYGNGGCTPCCHRCR